MKKIDLYIGRAVFNGIVLILIILVGLFTFFSFIDELGDVGTVHYTLETAIQYTILLIPLSIYDLFPASALLGSLVGLGLLASYNELTVMRAAGISIFRIILSVLAVGLPLTVGVMVLGEVVAPETERYAKNLKAAAQSDNQTIIFRQRYGFWARDGVYFVNIRTILPDGSFGDVTLYEFDAQQALQRLTHAQRAYYRGNEGGVAVENVGERREWVLEGVDKIVLKQSDVDKALMTRTVAVTDKWEAVLQPDLVKMVVVNPRTLSIAGLLAYIEYLQQSEQRTAEYELALWTRLSYPVAAVAMIFLAVPFVFGSLRTVTVGQRVLTGAFLGIGFYMLYKAAGNIGLLYGIHPAVSVLLPSLVAFALAGWLMRRVV